MKRPAESVIVRHLRPGSQDVDEPAGSGEDGRSSSSVATFLLIGIGINFAVTLIPPLVDAELLPFDLPLYGVLGGIFGVALAAFLVTAAT